MLKYLIACLGNPLMGDDGIGTLIAKELASEGLEVVICGSDLSPVLVRLDNLEVLIIVDAIDWGANPGSVIVARLEDFEEVRLRMSHSLPVTEILKLMKKLFGKPSDVYIIGVQPGHIKPGIEFTPQVRKAIHTVTAKVKDILAKIN